MKIEENLAPPLAPIEPHRALVHAEERVDHYFWLRNRDDPRVVAYLEAENAYTEAKTNHLESFREALYKEMLSRIKETDQTAPIRWGGNFYYSRTEEGKQYSISCRKLGSIQTPEQVLLDRNVLAEGHDYFRVGTVAVSEDQRLLAYNTDTEGNEVYTLVVKDLATDELLSDRIENTYYSVAWANDNRTFFYTVLDPAKRPYRLYRHVLGTDPGQDVLVYEESDEEFTLSASSTNSRRYLLINSSASVTDEWRYLPLDDPEGELRMVEPRRHGIEYEVAHQEERFLIRTNDQAKNFRMMQAPVSSPGRSNWEEVIPHREEVKITSVGAFKDYLVLQERKNGLTNIRILDTGKDADHYVEWPEPVYVALAAVGPEYDSTDVRLWYTSLVTPPTDFDYDMAKRELKTVKQLEVPGYDSSLYTSERVWAEATDGTRVPISLVHRKDLKKDGSNPIYLYGYGSYGASMDPYFSSQRLVFMERGFVCAIAHVRGGGELGETWRDDGRMLKKLNTFSDFITCAEYLVDQGYGSKDGIFIHGGSAGGLLLGAVVNMRPDLFRMVLSDVPFVDVINTMLDPSIPLTTLEYEEWGNPNDKEYYDYIMQYSPYDNVGDRKYPDILVTAGLNDPRVHYWEPAKWVAKLRVNNTSDGLILLKTNMGAGHAGASGRYDHLREDAFKYAFVLDRFGLG